MTDVLALLLAEHRPWHDRALCFDHPEPLWFPPTPGESRALKLGRERRAKAICARCPVAGHCYEYAVARDEWQNGGIWAGLSAKDVGVAHKRPKRPGGALGMRRANPGSRGSTGLVGPSQADPDPDGWHRRSWEAS